MPYKLHIRCSIGALVNPNDDKDVEYGVRLELDGIPTVEDAQAIDQWLRSLVTSHAHEVKNGATVIEDWDDTPEGQPS